MNKALEIFNELEKKVLPVIEEWKTDLKIDRDMIALADVPFIHAAGRWGTLCECLVEPDQYPAAGVKVPILFGKGDRSCVLGCRISGLEYIAERDENHSAIVHYWNGSKLREISKDRIIPMAREYKRRIESAWRREGVKYV